MDPDTTTKNTLDNYTDYDDLVDQIATDLVLSFDQFNTTDIHELAPSIIEPHVFDRGITRAAYILEHSTRSLGDWEHFTTPNSTDVDHLEAMAYTELEQDVIDAATTRHEHRKTIPV